MTQIINKKVEIRLSLENDEAREFIDIKNHYGLKSNAETVRLLIRKELEAIS